MNELVDRFIAWLQYIGWRIIPCKKGCHDQLYRVLVRGKKSVGIYFYKGGFTTLKEDAYLIREFNENWADRDDWIVSKDKFKGVHTWENRDLR